MVKDAAILGLGQVDLGLEEVVALPILDPGAFQFPEPVETGMQSALQRRTEAIMQVTFCIPLRRVE